MIRGVDEGGNGPQGESEAFAELKSLLRDPHRHETAAKWERVAQSELGPEDRRKAERMAPVVRRYLSREVEREEFEQQMAALDIPAVNDIPAT
jgi:hypothetical protein